MSARLACLAALIGLNLAPAIADPCNGSRAVLTGGFTIAMGGSSMTTRSELHLERSGPGVTGRWTGTVYRTTTVYSAPVYTLPSATPLVEIPGVEATCATTNPDSQTIDVRCEGRYPFTLHKDWTITWEGQSDVIGSYAPGDGGKPGRIEIDVLTNAPNYAVAKAVGMSAEVSGTVHGEMTGELNISVGDYGGDTLKLPSAKRLRLIAEMVPGKQNPGVDVTLTVTAGGKAAPGAIILPTPDPAIVDVVLHGTLPQQRMNQAQDIRVIGTATLGDCARLSDHTLLELMLAGGQTP